MVKSKPKKRAKKATPVTLKVPKFHGPVSPVMAIPKDVLYQSESEPPLENTMARVLENQEYVQKNFADRLAKEGKEFYTCPLCKETQGKNLTKKDVATHIKTKHKMRVQELKLIKAKKETYEPKQWIESPKPHLADVYPPHLREQMETQIAAAKLIKPLSDHAKALSKQGNHLIQMVMMNEGMAIQKLPTLKDTDLVAIYQMAANRGKRLLARQAKALCDKRNLNPYAMKKPSERALKIQETLMSAAFAATKRA